MTWHYKNDAYSTLSASITNVATTLTVTSATPFSTSGDFMIKIDSEYMKVTAVSGATFTVTRAQEGSTAVSHGSGATVTQVVTAGIFGSLGSNLIVADSATTVTGAVELHFPYIIDLGSGVVKIYASRPPSAARAALGTYGDECDSLTVDAAWTQRNITATGDGEKYVWSADASGDALHRAFTDPAADFELIAHIRGLTATGNMTGVFAVDASGNGAGFSIYDDGNAYMWTLASFVYSATGPSVTNSGFIMADHWVHMRRVGTNWNGRWSNDGDTWGSWTGNLSNSTTMTRVGVGSFFSKAVSPVKLERFVYGTPSITLP
jgi:hypothetical protein